MRPVFAPVPDDGRLFLAGALPGRRNGRYVPGSGRIDSLIFMILPMTLLCLLGNRRDWRQALRSGLNMIGPTMIALLTLAAFNCAFFGDTVRSTPG